ncbi:aluminum-activated malate transporter [Striga asiatica]|uniref:Aluminum-activated malate transporter n=1 Tax=Striga asiatica TaxID=4170 RepID=A0A5A7QCZ8_STRAF|nr:aluminum-activated malate transporter [Striga asiatica]
MCVFLKAKFVAMTKSVRKIGEDDPRKIVHSIKVGLALTLVSLFYYYRPLYDGFGQAGMWAVLTVVVVFEYTVGGTLGKCINRGGATLLAGALGVGAEYLASLCGEKGEPFVLAILVFFLASVSTFTRFLPNVKKRYDYGVLIFILTFSLVAVSGSRVDEILQLAHQRLSTILIGGATCIFISVSVCPVWAGQDLHDSTAANLEKLADFLQGFGGEPILVAQGDESCVISPKDDNSDKEKSYRKGYTSVLNSKQAEESLANFAWWEPSHGCFRLRHPWKQYLKIGTLARECACLMETLVGCVNSKPHVRSMESHIPDSQLKIQSTCVKMCVESGKALRELSSAIKSMTFPSPATDIHVQNSKYASEDLKTALEKSMFPAKSDLRELMPLLVIASTLTDITKCVEQISGSVGELAQKAHFKKPKAKQTNLLHRGIVKPIAQNFDRVNELREDDSVVIEISDVAPNNKNPLFVHSG